MKKSRRRQVPLFLELLLFKSWHSALVGEKKMLRKEKKKDCGFSSLVVWWLTGYAEWLLGVLDKFATERFNFFSLVGMVMVVFSVFQFKKLLFSKLNEK